MMHIPVEQFDWNPETQRYYAEASQLRKPDNSRLIEIGDKPHAFILVTKNARTVMVVHKVDVSDDYSGGWSVLEFVPAGQEPCFVRAVIFND